MSPRKLLSIGNDRLLFREGSAVRQRQAEYAKAWDEVHIVVFTNRSFTETAIAPNCWIYPTKSRSKFLYPFDAIRLGRFIIQKRGITEITCQDSSLTAMAGLTLKREFGVPVQIQIHEDIGSPTYSHRLSNRIRKMMAINYIPHADRIRVVSERIARYLTERLQIDRSKIEVRPISVDTESIRAASIREGGDLRKKYPEFAMMVLMASRLEREKNIATALRAWQLVLEKHPRAGLIIAGSGSEERRLRKLVAELGIEKQVIFTGWTDHQTLVSYYKTADVFLNTSLCEGYGMTLVEATAAGCRVISTDVGIAAEVGAIIVENNPDSIAEGIIRTLGRSIS